MKLYKRYALIFAFSLLFIFKVSAQDDDIYAKYDIYRNPVRVFLNKVSFTATSGYGATLYSHHLSGVYFFQDASSQYIFANDIEGLGETITAYSDWLNSPALGVESTLENPYDVPFDYLANPVNNPSLNNQTFLVNTDTTTIGFQGIGHGIPINLMLHLEQNNLRFGLGWSYERHFIRPLSPTHFENEIRPYEANFNSTRFTKLYGMVGYKFQQWWNYDFVAELNVGRIKSGPQFDNAAMSRGLYTNFGVSIENIWSEYFRLIFKPSIDFKSYTIALPDGATVKHSQPTLFMQVGVSINYPDIPRSPMKSDHVQLKHVYTDPVTGKRMEVRGQPITKRQNPKVGENHRKLWRYKKKNRKKLNPY